MAIREILLLGNPKLYEVSKEVKKEQLPTLLPVVQDLHDTLMDFRGKHGAGRAIAAPQIGMARMLIYMHIDQPTVFINPAFDLRSTENMIVWDDCMCFPDLLVKVKRHRRCRITYRDMEWKEHSVMLEGDLSELLQHEVDHLYGILAVSRAFGDRAFAFRSVLSKLEKERER